MADTYKPTEAMAKAAERGLKMREEQSPSNRGGTSVGLARARQLKNREPLSLDTVKRMYSFFSRHEVDKSSESWKKGDSKGEQAWLLWGGDAGYSWSKRIVKAEDKEAKSNMIKEEDGKWILYTKDGSRKLGEHPTKEAAIKQEEAIKASEARNHVILYANVNKTQIHESDTHYEIRGIPVTVDNAVMNGVLYPAAENAKGMPSLVGKPMALGHPTDDMGNFMSAREGEGLAEFFSGGVITKTYNRGGINYADANIKKSLLNAQERGGFLAEALADREPIGVSTGLLFDSNQVGGENYEMTAINQIYDHLAALPDSEPPAGGNATFMRFNSESDKTMVVNVSDYLPEDESLLDKAVNRILSALGIKDAASYNNDGGHQAEILSNKADEVAMDRKKMEALAKNMGYKYNEDMSDDDMYNGMMDYAKKNGMKPKMDDEKKPMEKKNSAEDISAIVEAAVNAAVKPLQDQLKAQSETELNQLASDVAGLKMGINEEAAKAMGVNACRDFLAANQPAYSMGSTAFRGNSKGESTAADMKAPWEVKQ